MPHYIDVHDLAGADMNAVAEAHAADVKIQAKYGVSYIKLWFNESRGKVFCLASAPSAEAADNVHREAHGMSAERIIQVDPDLADGFLGGGAVGAFGEARLAKDGPCDPGQRTILFTDIVGSTAMTQRLGDDGAMKVLEVHDGLVRRVLAATRGREVKHLGDGIMAAFVSAVDAVRCASMIQAELAESARTRTRAGETMELRIGIASGDPVERNGDFFGSTVQLAARLCAKAEPGQALVSESVLALCHDSHAVFSAVGAFSLKGFEEPVPAHALVSVPGQS